MRWRLIVKIFLSHASVSWMAAPLGICQGLSLPEFS
jgi:hypothetical protein